METRRGKRLRLEAAAPISKLGDDLLGEILIRLPNPRSACRCKSVCKRWKSMISSPCFNQEFLSHYQGMRMNKAPPPLIPSLDCDWQEPMMKMMSFLPYPPRPGHIAAAAEDRIYFTVLDCFKDLLLCEVSHVDYPEKDELGRSFLVCNPFTKQWVALPLAPEEPRDGWVCATRLVCLPRTSYNVVAEEEDDDQLAAPGNGFAAAAYSEYRFRVVCLLESMTDSIILDVFCSESGEWTKEALVLDLYSLLSNKNVCSCNGELIWWCRKDSSRPFLLAVNIFQLDMPPTPIDVSTVIPVDYSYLDISTSQGALHLIVQDLNTRTLSVWRLEDDYSSWRKHCEGLFKTMMATKTTATSMCKYHVCNFKVVDLHREKPEIVYFGYNDDYNDVAGLLSYDLGRGELEVVSDQYHHCWKIFQPRVPCWPTPIPRYEELQGMYDGSFDWFGRAGKRQRRCRRKKDKAIISCNTGH